MQYTWHQYYIVCFWVVGKDMLVKQYLLYACEILKIMDVQSLK